MHLPPLMHWQMGMRQVSPVHSDGQVHVNGPSGFVQLPPLPQVSSHTGVVQLESNQPGVQVHVSGAAQKPWTQVWMHMGVVQLAPV